MEKSANYSPLPPQTKQFSWNTSTRTILASLLLVVGLFHYKYGALFSDESLICISKTSWRSGPPTYRSKNATIGWHVCPDTPDNVSYTFWCSTIKTPLNWLDPVEGEDAEIFLRMLPADKDKTRMGSLLLNPGGPGGSGNSFLYGAGEGLSLLTGGNYDLIGFDPRGVNMSTPRLNPFDNDYDNLLFELAIQSPLSHDPSKPFNASGKYEYAAEYKYMQTIQDKAQMQMELVKRRHGERFLKSVSTPFVVRDMVAILDGLGDGPLLNYWGFSYGTILGAHFAAMFPERVGRMILDGVSHAGDYTKGAMEWGWSSLTDTNKVFAEFGRICAEVGPERCALASSNRTLSVEAGSHFVNSRVMDLIHQLYERPMPVLGADIPATFIPADYVHGLLAAALYSPKTWQQTAAAIAHGLKGNGTALINLIGMPRALGDPAWGRRADTENVFGMPLGDAAGVNGIACTDSSLDEHTLDDWIKYASDLRARGMIAEEWLTLLISCRAWGTTRPFERYPGPWTASEGLRKTKNKLLWIGNIYDNVTPLKSAERMAEGFGRNSSTLLITKSHGHCSVAEASLCTAGYIMNFFATGAIPDWGTVCDVIPGQIFPESSASLFNGLTQGAQDIVQAMQSVQASLLK